MKYFLTIAIAAIVTLGFNSFVTGDKPTVLSGIDSGPNKATTTASFGAVTADSSRVLKTGSGVLSAIIVSNETVGTFNVYDATTTLAHPNHATTTLFNAYAGLAENTYEFEVAFTRGLLIEFPSTNVASATITWR